MAGREKKGKAKIQTFEYLDSEKSILDEINCIFQNYSRGITWLKNKKRWSPGKEDTKKRR